MHFKPPDSRIRGHAEWNVPCTTVFGRLPSSVRLSRSRYDDASMPLMLWPCVARIRKCDGSVSPRAASAFCVAVSWAALVAGGVILALALESSGTGVVGAAGGTGGWVAVVDSDSSDGTWKRAKRFLSDSATALRISGRVTFRDLSFRQDS